MARERFVPHPAGSAGTSPFATAEEAWFWFMQTYDARQAGARVVAGLGNTPRPCEPLDLLQVIDRLYRQRRLLRDHLCVLAFYGRRLTAPDPRYNREARASLLWREAFERLAPVLRGKGIVA